MDRVMVRPLTDAEADALGIPSTFFHERHPRKMDVCRLDADRICLYHGVSAFMHETFGEGWTPTDVSGPSSNA